MSWAVVSVAGLTAVYVAALGRAAPGDLVLGVTLAIAARWMVRPHALRSPSDSGPGPLVRLLWLGPLVTIVAARALVASVTFLRYLWRTDRLDASGFVEIPFGDRTPLGVAATGLCVSLTPGAVMIDVDETKNVMVFQLADATHAEAFVADQEHFYRRWQRRVVP